MSGKAPGRTTSVSAMRPLGPMKKAEIFHPRLKNHTAQRTTQLQKPPNRVYSTCRHTATKTATRIGITSSMSTSSKIRGSIAIAFAVASQVQTRYKQRATDLYTSVDIAILAKVPGTCLTKDASSDSPLNMLLPSPTKPRYSAMPIPAMVITYS